MNAKLLAAEINNQRKDPEICQHTWACDLLLNSHQISNILRGCDIILYIMLTKQKLQKFNATFF